MPFLTNIKALAERLEVINPKEVQGCTEAEIQSLENVLQIQLPEAYREFLAWVGKQAGAFMDDDEWRHIGDTLVFIQQEAQELRRYYSLKLPMNAYVFLMHQSSVFYFFILSEGNNPPIYTEDNTGDKFRKEYCSFTEFLEHTILYMYIVENRSIHENYFWLNEQYIPCKQ